MKHNDFITIGVIIAPHGVRGDLRIMPQTDFPERFMHMDACYICLLYTSDAADEL